MTLAERRLPQRGSGDLMRVLVVEDDATLREALCDTIEFGGYQVLSACNGIEALAQLESAAVDLVVSDVQMDRMDGRELLRDIRVRHPDLPFVMITAHGSVADAVQAMRDGATDYLLKPFEAEVLLDMLERFAPVAREDDQAPVALDPVMQRVLELAKRIAASDGTILISGESGTGKEVLARYLHRHSNRAGQPFVAVNCAAIPENMLESMLFGYEKGAYTGAHQSRAGKFEQAEGGTLLLDEVSEMDIGLQAKLLRVLQEREVERLGGSRPIPLDVRVLATTNRQLADAVNDGHFREDLYYRLNVLPLRVPALRERPADIIPLAERFLLRYAPAGRELAFSEDALERLRQGRWRGNVRELENSVQRAAILCGGQVVRAADLDFADSLQQAVSEAPPVDVEPPLAGDLKDRERELIVAALSATRGVRKDAAQKLGISPRTLRYKLARMKEQGMDIPGVRGQ
ncbi:MAG: sigma-54 dependent transcriptional regulator [Chromatocurvus sp.]